MQPGVHRRPVLDRHRVMLRSGVNPPARAASPCPRSAMSRHRTGSTPAKIGTEFQARTGVGAAPVVANTERRRHRPTIGKRERP